MKRLGKKALIVTGINSSKLNGSLDDVITALEKENIRYKIFDQIDDNPTIDIIQQAFDENEREGISFIIGLGKGSPIDAAKALVYFSVTAESAVGKLLTWKTSFHSHCSRSHNSRNR